MMVTMGERELEWMPYLIAIVFIVIFLFLIYIRKLLGKEEESSGIRIGNGQTIGRRDEQDDYFSTATTSHGTIAVLADGISGLANGRMASTLAVDVFIQKFLELNHINDIPHFFTEASRLSNAEIIRSLKGANGGTTLVVAVISDGYLYWGAVGDSLIMIFRDGEFININHKHILESVLEERYLAGEITKYEALDNPMKNRLINYLGYEGFKNIEICKTPIALNKGDRVILCSDGVYNSVTEIELEKILSKNTSPYDAAQEIIEAVNDKRLKNQDNATIIVLENG
ncbi:protein phosphatase 2C [Aneurinibacillus aneurinilyticus ATCC 12856]|uniref:Protein phosphatase 2C n=2 Tax=Aneurinibacillus aneurinilyticus TaxID=1391 RepID=U1XXE1_ANEAE|nr:protein phosphatase 2C [Aneurinibacillus aneurinilyticus ATCC 12856]